MTANIGHNSTPGVRGPVRAATSYTTRETRSVTRAEWDGWLQDSPGGGHVLQSYEWGEFKRRLGFFYRKGRRNSLLVKFADRGLQKMANDTANWSYTVGDGEASFWTR